MKRLLMACVLGMALAFCMSGCKSSDWNPFSTDNPKTTCSCCGKANCKCPKDANGVCKCQCCKNGADKCKCCNQYDLCSCCGKNLSLCKCPKDENGKCKCECCKNGSGKCKCCNNDDIQ